MATDTAMATTTRAAATVCATSNNNKNDHNKHNTNDNDDSLQLLQEPLLPSSTAIVDAVQAQVSSDDDNDNGNDNLEEPTAQVQLLQSSGLDDDNVDAVVFDESGWDHPDHHHLATGEEQPKVYRDWFWGILFLVQLMIVVAFAIMGIRNMIHHASEWLPSSNDDNRSNENDDDDTNAEDRQQLQFVWFLLSMIGSVIVIASILLNVLLGVLAPMLIQISLCLSPLLSGITCIGFILTLNLPLAILSAVMSIMGIYYAVRVWHKVPFATANLKIALQAIQDNHGLWILAYGITVQTYLWTFLWFCAVVELMTFSSSSWVYDCNDNDSNNDNINDDDNTDTDSCHTSTKGKCIALSMLLSLFWTCQVVKNILHTTIAGVVGTWWFDPEEARSASARGGSTSTSSGCCRCTTGCGCSRAIYDSWYRSSVYSFGSICFGSLLVGILQVLQFIVRCGRRQQQQEDQHRRRHGNGLRPLQSSGFIFCLLQVVVDALEYLLEYFNTWAFVYVGLYGYDYWTAGKTVSTLFQARGWSVIINDHLVGRSLGMMSFLISIITGLVGSVLGMIFLGAPVVTAVPSFFLGMVLGGASCEVLFGVVVSAVNTIVVCFAESPNQLRLNHPPELSNDLIEAWRKAYPEDCGF